MRKQTERNGKSLKVTGIQYVPAPDVDKRVSRAVNILLKAAKRNISESEDSKNGAKKEPPRPVPAEDAPTGRGEAVSDE
jgi:hypothetical protein